MPNNTVHKKRFNHLRIDVVSVVPLYRRVYTLQTYRLQRLTAVSSRLRAADCNLTQSVTPPDQRVAPASRGVYTLVSVAYTHAAFAAAPLLKRASPTLWTTTLGRGSVAPRKQTHDIFTLSSSRPTLSIVPPHWSHDVAFLAKQHSS